MFTGFQFSRTMLNRIRNVGFLKYWTVSNIPLFLLSAPMLAILFYSAYDQFFPASSTTRSGKPSFKLTANTKKSKPRKSLAQLPESPEKAVLIRLALPQLALSILALTGFHVQIINRISSGYPIWYMFLASSFLGKQAKAGVPSSDGGTWHRQAVRGMVVYALVQDVLYSSFLPPA
jgi:GPI mannosyltransferase 2